VRRLPSVRRPTRCFLALLAVFAAFLHAVPAASAVAAALGSPAEGGTTGESAGRVTRTGDPSTCSGSKPFPGVTAGGVHRYDAYTYTNDTETDVCLTVSLATNGERQLFSVAYRGAFNPAEPGADYLGDSGRSTNAALGAVGYAISVAAGETVTVIVTEATAGNANGQPYELELSLTGVGFTRSSIAALESGAPLTLTLHRSGDLSASTSVSFATADGLGEFPATAPGDYLPQSGSVTFSAGQKTATMAVQLVDDSAAEGAEEFRLLLTDVETGAGIGPHASVSIEVRDDDPRPVRRLAGDDRVATAIAVSQAALPDAASAAGVILASAGGFADALAGTPLAVARDGVVLLTPREALDDRVRAEIGRVMQPDGTVYVLGGPHAISEAVVDALVASGFHTQRVAGADRFETAVAVAGLFEDPATIYLATGRDFPDAIAAGAAAGVSAGVVLLTDGPRMPDSTNDFLRTHPNVPVNAIGGDAERAMPSAASFVGEDRYATAVLVADHVLSGSTTVGVASGERFPDAITGGAHIAALGGALVLTRADSLPEATADWLVDAPVIAPFVYGGPVAISDAVVAAIEAALQDH
jgi:putative cell wall-binding protein